MVRKKWYRECSWIDKISEKETIQGVFYRTLKNYLKEENVSLNSYFNLLHKRVTGIDITNGTAHYTVRKLVKANKIPFPYLIDNMTEVFEVDERAFLCWYYVNRQLRGNIRLSKLLKPYYDEYDGAKLNEVPKLFDIGKEEEDLNVVVKKLSKEEKLRKEMKRKDILERALAIEIAEGRLHKSIPYGDLKATWK